MEPMILISNEKELRIATKAILSDLFYQGKINTSEIQYEKIINLLGEKRYRLTKLFPIEKLIPIIQEEIEIFNNSDYPKEKIVRNEQDLKSAIEATISNLKLNNILEMDINDVAIELDGAGFKIAKSFPIAKLVSELNKGVCQLKQNIIQKEINAERCFVEENILHRGFLYINENNTGGYLIKVENIYQNEINLQLFFSDSNISLFGDIYKYSRSLDNKTCLYKKTQMENIEPRLLYKKNNNSINLINGLKEISEEEFNKLIKSIENKIDEIMEESVDFYLKNNINFLYFFIKIPIQSPKFQTIK